jgi:NAD(P)-dependent dehydrogenase (short-subunit alcohol dehydrogenase family)
MDLENKVVVVTGAADGIGRAMARRFVAEGARGVVVADINGDKVTEVANEIGATALRVDVSQADQIAALVELAESTYGPIDLFCSNAGVPGKPGLSDDLADWQRTWEINVLAHVHAANAVLPSMLARSEGYLLNTCSAAGILTQIGAAPYSVTKHAAVAFAEWLSVTYGDRGIKVSVLCPMGVNTNMLNGGFAPTDAPTSSAAAAVTSAGVTLESSDVAEVVVHALAAEKFLVLPHPEVLTMWQRKTSDYDRWLNGMRRFQARVEGRL